MENDKIKSIKISLLESKSDINDDHKTEYISKASAVLKMEGIIKQTVAEHSLENVLDFMYKDLLQANEEKIDSVGIWVDYDGKVLENSMNLKILEDMEKYTDDEIYPIYELFKLVK